MKNIFLLLGVLALVGAGCATDTQIEQVNEPVVIDEIIINDGRAEIVVDLTDDTITDATLPVYDVEMRAGNFFFEPASMAVQTGQVVEVHFTDVVGIHTFVIDELGINETVEAGKTIKFTAPLDGGQYWFYCDAGNHRELGMEGVLGVKEL